MPRTRRRRAIAASLAGAPATLASGCGGADEAGGVDQRRGFIDARVGKGPES